MNLLLIGIDNDIRDVLISSLLPKGFPVYSCGYKDDIFQIISKKEINVVFIDVDKEGGLIEQLNLIKKIKASNVSIITYIENEYQSDIKLLVEAGVTANIIKTTKKTEDIKKLIGIIFQKVPKQEKRQALRVRPEEGEEATINFSIPNSNIVVKGNVIELSYLGCVVKIQDNTDTRKLKVGDSIGKMAITINSKRALTDGQVIMMKNDYIGVKFLEHDASLKSLLVRYIYDKMSEF